MPDHIHVLITPAIDQSTARCAQLIKGGYSFAARDHSPREIWQSGYHEHRIRDAEDYRNQLLYIANNPVEDNLIDHPHVHTADTYAHLIDPDPLQAPRNPPPPISSNL